MPSPKPPTPLMRALPLALATLLGAALALAATWFFDAPPAPDAAPVIAPADPAPPPPPNPSTPPPPAPSPSPPSSKPASPTPPSNTASTPPRPRPRPRRDHPPRRLHLPRRTRLRPSSTPSPPPPRPPASPSSNPSAATAPAAPSTAPSATAPTPRSRSAATPGPRLTIIIGDVGREPALLDPLIALDPDITFAIMANAPHAPAVAARLAETGRGLLAHLPSSPPPALPDGPDALTTDDDPATTATKARALLDRVPGAAGADTHQGDRFTPSRPHVAALLDVIAERGLFFIDGRHSDASVALPIAAAQGIRAAARTHDLDHGDGPIDTRLRAIEVALVLDGEAIVTLTPTPEAITALAAWTLTLRARGIHLLRASEIVR
ncbi:MAG: divergent polysaccharide deacetylase family protein [bacterium]